jgi:signal transduction histidine kinase
MDNNYSTIFPSLPTKTKRTKYNETQTFGVDQRKSSLAWKDILYMLAHDMKNPILSAGGFLSRLLSGKYGRFTEIQLDYLRLIRENLVELDRLIKQLLEFLRFESKEYKLVLKPLNIKKTLRKNIEFLKIEADKKNIKIIFNEPEDIELVINADAGMINRVFINLLENAVKYTNQGGTITVNLSDIGSYILIQIIDTGIGIPENNLDYIFDAFYCGKIDSNSFGLGLFIAKSIIEAHRGRIWVESIVNKGTTFSFMLPK